MTLRTAADALAEAVAQAVAVAEGQGLSLDGLKSALAAYRAATAQAKRESPVHLSLYGHGEWHHTLCFPHPWSARHVTTDPAAVTCKLCRKTRKFQEASP